MSRMYTRSRLARTLLEKENFENELSNFDKSEWYMVNLQKLPSTLVSTFVQMEYDPGTAAFLDQCREVTDSVCRQIFYDIASAILKIFYTKTCVNGMLGRGVMFIFSFLHLSDLLSGYVDTSQNRYGAVLDLGAGTGDITDKFRPYFDIIYATEASPAMRRQLQNRGIKLLSIDEWWRQDNTTPQFRLISCLNLLDRHPAPLTLLKQIHTKAKSDDALVLLAVVLPWCQYVEYQTEKVDFARSVPKELIVLNGKTFEEQLKHFVENILIPNGFQLLRWTRLPYLCEGDLTQSVYFLDDAVLLVKPI